MIACSVKESSWLCDMKQKKKKCPECFLSSFFNISLQETEYSLVPKKFWVAEVVSIDRGEGIGFLCL